MSWVKVTCKEDGNGVYIKWESVVALSWNHKGHTDILLDCVGAEKILHAKETPEEIMTAMGYTKKEFEDGDVRKEAA